MPEFEGIPPPTVDDLMAIYTMLQAGGANLPPLIPSSTPGESAGGSKRAKASVHIDARRQYIALATACNPRCGSRSGARLMSTITGHLFQQLWFDWIRGTELALFASVWKIPEAEADEISRIPPSRRAAIKPQESYMADAACFGVSLLTLGITTHAIELMDDGIMKADLNRSVVLQKQPTLELWDAGRAKGPREMAICDASSMTQVTHFAANDEWVLFAGAGTRRQVPPVRGYSAGYEAIGIVDIDQGRLEPRWAARHVHPVLVPVPGRLGRSAVLRLDFFLGEPMVTFFEDAGDGSGDVIFWCSAFAPIESCQSGMLVSDHSSCFGLPRGCSLECVARLRKRDGECILIVGTNRPVGTRDRFIEVPEGHCFPRSNSIRNLRTMGTDLVTVSDSLFGLYSPGCSPISHLFEVWDCNDTSKPLKVIQLATQFVLPSLGAPPSAAAAAVKKNLRRKVEALYGFLFHWVDNKLHVIEARSELTVITLDLPRGDDSSAAWVPGLHVWCPYPLHRRITP
ncbi:hypothetical protein Pelo_17643 [Pelomyxa schiedti]|nr:hypothetical protein Pelo_17643 [Pelomyxa schiedti]